MDEIKSKLDELKIRFQNISDSLDREKLRGEIRELEAETMKQDFWKNHETATKKSIILSNKIKLQNSLEHQETRIKTIEGLIEDQNKSVDGWSEDNTSVIESEIREAQETNEDLELKLFLSGPHDESESIISIHSGAGGVEAMDWAAMLARMYQRYFERMGWKYEITDESFGEEAGYKEISMIVHAPLSYGYLKKEAGTHRLVRQSPFNADKLRQTSFALVEVLPVIEDEKEIEIKDDEVGFESFRSGGKGGQNVNKVSTAVRIRHKPTGIIVTAQTERFQAQNRENAMKLLRAKLWKLQEAQRKETTQELKKGKSQASWGTQIRSYVLHPYHMVKDLRTGVETSDTDAVLDGDLKQFIEKSLIYG